ncbi:MAG TPA: hypothetical protein VGM90_37630 [Kofleriaceae bacterium]|jgi:hypothetical protein
MRAVVLVPFALLVACGAHAGDGSGADAGSGDPCTGSETRCLNNDYQTCADGTFQETQSCSDICVPDLGCAQCDPSAAGNTCNGNAVVTCNADGTFGSTVSTCGNGMMCNAGTCTNACTADGVDLVYVVDEANHFLSFDPRKLPGDPFTLIGTLSCPAHPPSILVNNPNVIPFSMSVDRDGVAWVLYTSGELFKVSLTNAACTAAGNTVAAGGMSLFGMGFVTDAAGGMTEKLYLGGGNTNPQQGPRKLAYDDTHANNLTPVAVGTITATPAKFSPELTGTSEARLFGFFPNLTTVAYVQEIDKTSGAPIGSTFPLGTTGLGTNINDWAFAQWGGVFYVFVTTSDANMQNRNSTVRSIDRATGTYKVELQNVPYFIDGAGVSTCAPVMIQ